MTDYLDLKPGPFEQTTVQGGLAKLVRIWEYLRDLNEGGYGTGRLVQMKNGPDKTSNKKTDCSPFTATCIYMALDPREVDVSKAYQLEEPYDPRFDGGKVLTRRFYHLHNSFQQAEYKTKSGAWSPDFKSQYIDKIPNLFKDWKWIDHSAGSVVIHNLGVPVDDKKMRRGDVVGIDWMNKGGHAVFCWNVHLDERDEVDCFQYVSANGSHASGGPGVTVSQYPVDERYLDTSGGKYRKKPGKEMFTKVIDDPKAYPEYVSAPYIWYALRHINKGDIDTGSFGVPKDQVRILDWKSEWKGYKQGIDEVHVSRLFGVTPPEPWLRANGKTASDSTAPKAKPTPVTTVKSKPVEGQAPGAEEQKKPEKKVEPKPTAEGEVQEHQLEVEIYLQKLWAARWIAVDPGKPDSVNDPQSQAAVKDFQQKYMKGDKIPHPGYADPASRKRLAKYAAWATAMPIVKLSLRMLHDHGQLEHAPGDDPAQLDETTLAAVKEFQKKKGLNVDGIPGTMTQGALADAMKGLGEKTPEAAPTKTAPAQAEKPAPEKKGPADKPAIWTLYFTRNYGKAGDKVSLVVLAKNSEGKSYSIGLFQDDKALVENAGQVTIKKQQGRLDLQIPAGLAPGALVQARLSGEGLTAKTPVLFEVETADAASETADWRPHVGKDSVPDAVLEAVRKNRAKYPVKDLPPAKGKWAGAHHYDYYPPDDHAKWAKDYFKKKFDGATMERKHQLTAYLEMLDREGRPASIQTYDNQIVTWGVGLGALGNGKDAFKNLDKDPQMKKLLDDVGINFFDGDYHVVDLAKKKVVSSTYSKEGKGDDLRHEVPLKSWREQPDLLSAIIGISEDAATREAVAESQFAVYLAGAAAWSGQDKVFTQALYFFITHMRAWLPAIANGGFNVNQEFQAIAGGTPSMETDKKLAPRLANGFVRYSKTYFPKFPKKYKDPAASYADVRDRTKTHLWKAMRDDGKKEGFDPGELTYDFD